MRRIVLGMLGAIIFAGAWACPRPAAAQTDPEIVELARALKGDPDLIYEYVYNNIETLPQYGSLKGSLGALLDGKGTAFDQAELMVALLQQAGVPASFVLGGIDLTAAQLTNWLGVDNALGSVDFTLGSGGFPATITSSGGIVSTVKIGWAWARSRSAAQPSYSTPPPRPTPAPPV